MVVIWSGYVVLSGQFCIWGSSFSNARFSSWHFLFTINDQVFALGINSNVIWYWVLLLEDSYSTEWSVTFKIESRIICVRVALQEQESQPVTCTWLDWVSYTSSCRDFYPQKGIISLSWSSFIDFLYLSTVYLIHFQFTS